MVHSGGGGGGSKNRTKWQKGYQVIANIESKTKCKSTHPKQNLVAWMPTTSLCHWISCRLGQNFSGIINLLFHVHSQGCCVLCLFLFASKRTEFSVFPASIAYNFFSLDSLKRKHFHWDQVNISLYCMVCPSTYIIYVNRYRIPFYFSLSLSLAPNLRSLFMCAYFLLFFHLVHFILFI